MEVKGVPDNQDAQELILKMSEIVVEPLTKDEIDLCHRVSRAKKYELNIVVRFKSNSFLSRQKRCGSRQLKLAALKWARVYVNEHKTRQNTQFLGSAVAKKNQAGMKYAWAKNAKSSRAEKIRRDTPSSCPKRCRQNNFDHKSGWIFLFIDG